MTADLFATSYGNYYGNGVTGASNTGNGSSGGRQRQATYMNINQFTKNNAANYSEDFKNINDYFLNGETERGLEELWALEDEYKSILEQTTNCTVTDKNVSTIVGNGFLSATGRDLSTAANLDSEFVNEFKKSLGFGLGSIFTADCSEEEFLELKMGNKKSDVSNKVKVKGKLGSMLGGAVTGLAVVTVGSLAIASSFPALIVLGIGAGIGASLGFIRKTSDDK